MLGKTTADGYIAVRYTRLACEARALHVPRKTLPYLALEYLLFLKDSSDLSIYPIFPLIELPIHISPYNKLISRFKKIFF